jgi:hexosaminidase
MFNITRSGFHLLLYSCLYLNDISYGTDLPQYYACDPQNFNATEEQNKFVTSGEACMWGTSHLTLNLIYK